MRSIEKIIREIIDTLPDFLKRDTSPLIYDLNKVISDSHYTAPEAMGLRWQQLGEHLHYHLKDYEQEEWCQKVQAIVQGK